MLLQSGTNGDTGGAEGAGGSKGALLRKALNDKGWAEKQTMGFTTWLNFTMGDAAENRTGSGGDGVDREEDDARDRSGEDDGTSRGISSSPLKAMVAMVRE